MTPLPETPSPTTSKRNLAAFGVMLVIFLFAVDATIVSTAMPTIVANLGGLELYSWVFSIYMLTSALTTPLFGKLSDLYSQRRLMLIGIAIFVFGSTLCGLAPSMEALVLFRAIQGLGGGAIYALSFIVVGILYSPAQRAKMQSLISGVWGVASILGPLAGGIIVEFWSWHWAFFVNLPITAVAIALIVVGLKETGQERHGHKLDMAGTVTLMLALMVLFYALSRASHSHRTLDLELTTMIVAGFGLLAVFYFIERRAAEPIVPLDLFRLETLQNLRCRDRTGIHGSLRRRQLSATLSSGRHRVDGVARRHGAFIRQRSLDRRQLDRRAGVEPLRLSRGRHCRNVSFVDRLQPVRAFP